MNHLRWMCLVLLSMAMLTAAAAPAKSQPEQKSRSVRKKEIRFRWETDFKAAQKRAEKEKKPMLVLFTGSDWCPYCVRLEQEILSKDVFKEFAAEEVVAVYLDFPKRRRLPKKQQEANDRLRKKFEIRGYPSMLLLDQEGKDVQNRFGYSKVDPDTYVKHLRDAVAQYHEKSRKRSLNNTIIRKR